MCRRLLAFILLTAVVRLAGQDVAVPDDLVIRLERTTCFGTCPAYSVTITATGQVTYQGHRFVRVSGRQVDRIPVSRVADLLAMAERIGFFEMRDRYSANITDHPTTFVTITRRGESKRIEDYIVGPESLKQLQRAIDDAARTRRWISIDEPELRRLIAEGRTPDAATRADLLRTALDADDTALIKALLETGVDPNDQRLGNKTLPLMMVESGAAVRALLSAGADPRAQAVNGGTPLWWAACRGHIEAVRILLEAGADPRVAAHGRTPLECARAGAASEQSRPRSAGERRPTYTVDFDDVIAVLSAATSKRN